MTDYKNFIEFFKYFTKLYSLNPVIYWKDGEKYENISGKKLKECVYQLASSLEKLGIKSGDKAAIVSETRIEWVISDFACIAGGIVTVPIYTTMTSQQIKFILEHSEAKICFTSTNLITEKVSSIFNELPNLKHIIAFNKTNDKQNNLINFEELVSGNYSYDETKADKYFDTNSSKTIENDLMTIIYTSGTTGNPKGVCLSHKNILSNVKQCTDSFEVTSDDRFLSFLPLAHTYERTAGYYLPLSKGAKIYYAQSIDTLQAQMAELKPTIVLAVPILFNKIKNRIINNIDSQRGFKKLIAKRALKTGMKHRNNKDNFFWKIADKKVFKQIRERTGGKIRFFISGGSALNKEVAEFFDSFGITIMQGYGMTEASPVISVNREYLNKFGTVGPPLEGVEVKLANDREIIVKGDNVMLGYYNNEKDTKQTVKNGWLLTGDIGVRDEDGYIIITDRKKTLIKTSGGKYISLTHIEDTIGKSKYIEQVITFASDEKHFVSALVVPNFDELYSYSKEHNIDCKNNIELISNKSIIGFLTKEINETQKHLAKYERVRKFEILPKPFTIDSGEMTPTLKLKRKVIEEKYRVVIEGFYT